MWLCVRSKGVRNVLLVLVPHTTKIEKASERVKTPLSAFLGVKMLFLSAVSVCDFERAIVPQKVL